MNDLRQSTEYAAYIEKIGWKVISVGGPAASVQVFIRRLGILGAIAKIQRVNLPLPWDKIRPILKQHRVWMTKVEPLAPSSQFTVLSSQLGKLGFCQDNWPLLATKTLRVDLTPPLSKILAGFKKDCRYCIRRSQRLATSVQINNYDGFYELWRKAARIKRLWIPPKWQYDALIESFGRKALCLTIADLAGAVVLIHNQIAYYYYAAALPEAKRCYLPYTGVWKLMQKAKQHRCTIWDFEGIFDSRWPNRNILGYSHFKKSFGGYEVFFPGSFTRWF